jgi:hypothetical protein
VKKAWLRAELALILFEGSRFSILVSRSKVEGLKSLYLS